MTVFMAYWTEDGVPNSKGFGENEMGEMLIFTQSLRTRQYAGEDISFVTSASENPNCVGKMGVESTGPEYNWVKRRDTRLRKDMK